ncbi:MAG: hypothetical protein ACKOXF_05340 [Chitinophagaceae bacterium]
MNTYSINQIKKTISSMDAGDLAAICLRMAKYKKENKELLSYLLYESTDEANYIEQVQAEIDMMFDLLIDNGSYKYMKQIRKIARFISKPMKYSGQASTQVEILIYFTTKLKVILKKKSNLTALQNLYLQQIKKIDTTMSKLHEDIQYDYVRTIESLRL